MSKQETTASRRCAPFGIVDEMSMPFKPCPRAANIKFFALCCDRLK
jgi:hypothetical protein